MATESQKFWSRWIITAVVFGILSTMGSYIFARVTEIPTIYCTKEESLRRDTELKDEMEKHNEELNHKQEVMQEKMDRGFTRILEKIDEIQIYLRNHN